MTSRYVNCYSLMEIWYKQGQDVSPRRLTSPTSYYIQQCPAATTIQHEKGRFRIACDEVLQNISTYLFVAGAFLHNDAVILGGTNKFYC